VCQTLLSWAPGSGDLGNHSPCFWRKINYLTLPLPYLPSLALAHSSLSLPLASWETEQRFLPLTLCVKWLSEGRLAASLIIRRNGESPPKLKSMWGHAKVFSHNKDVVNHEVDCCSQGILEEHKKKGHGGVSYLYTSVVSYSAQWWAKIDLWQDLGCFPLSQTDQSEISGNTRGKWNIFWSNWANQ